MHMRSRRRLQDALTAIRHKTTVREAGHALFANGERHLRSRLARVEKRMGELAQLAKELDEQLADPALYAAAERTRQLDLTAQRARVAQETGDVEAEWLEISEELERA